MIYSGIPRVSPIQDFMKKPTFVNDNIGTNKNHKSLVYVSINFCGDSEEPNFRFEKLKEFAKFPEKAEERFSQPCSQNFWRNLGNFRGHFEEPNFRFRKFKEFAKIFGESRTVHSQSYYAKYARSFNQAYFPVVFFYS